jgi:hypothetical protein
MVVRSQVHPARKVFVIWAAGIPQKVLRAPARHTAVPASLLLQVFMLTW